MYFHNVIVYDIADIILEHYNGNDDNYEKTKDDTEEAIYVFNHLSKNVFGNVVTMMEYLIKNLDLSGKRIPRDSEYERDSYYRAFLSLYNDSIFLFRLSRHDGTTSSTEGGWVQDGIPDIQFNLVLLPVKQTSKGKVIDTSGKFHNVPIEVCHISLSDFVGSDGKRWDFTRKVINYLTYGKPNISESKQHKHMKKTITESQLRNIIAESVKKVLFEGQYSGEEGEYIPDETDINPDYSFLHQGINDFVNHDDDNNASLKRNRYYENEYQKCSELWNMLNAKLDSMNKTLGLNREDYDEGTLSRLQNARKYISSALSELNC